MLDCQQFDGSSEGNIAAVTEPTQRQHSTPHCKKSRNRSLRERRHSFKHAVTQESEDESSSRSALFSTFSCSIFTYLSSDAFSLDILILLTSFRAVINP